MKYLTLLLAGLVLTAGQAVAQRPPDTHRGAWFSGGLGGGLMEGVRGGAVYLRVGGTPTERALFGGEVITWFRDAASRNQRRGDGTALSLLREVRGPGSRSLLQGKLRGRRDQWRRHGRRNNAWKRVRLPTRQQLLRHPERGFPYPVPRGADGHDDPLHARPGSSLTSSVAFWGDVL